MNKQQQLLSLLHSQLLNFGLNPQDWTVRQIQALNFIVENRQDQNFQFKGTLEFKSQQPAWKSMELFSI